MTWAGACLLLGALVLAGCEAVRPVGVADVGLRAVRDLTQTAPAPEPVPDRAILMALGAPVVTLMIGDAAPRVLTRQAVTGDYGDYRATDRTGIVLRGHAVARTYGLETDLTGALYAEDDPIADPRPLEQWPGQVDRAYQYRVRDLEATALTLTCVFARGPRSRIEIVERSHEVVEVIETCRDATRTVENRHWVAPETGAVWRSRQWVAPSASPLTVETVRLPEAAPGG
jgi:hypothetical protein